MANTSAVYARIDTQLKKNAEEILSQLGITPSSAIQMLYSQIVLSRGLPSKTNYLQIFRHIDSSVKICRGLLHIQLLSRLHMVILRMVQDQIFHTQFLCQYRRIFRRTVVLFIGIILISIRKQAERLAHQIIAPLRINTAAL